MGYLNPLFRLPAAKALLALGRPERAAMAALLLDLRAQANEEAEKAWARRKGPMACYWRAVSTYARHVAHLLRHGRGPDPEVPAGDDLARLKRDAEMARRQVTLLVNAAAAALPLELHPAQPSPESWARQLAAVAAPGAASGLQLSLLLSATAETPPH